MELKDVVNFLSDYDDHKFEATVVVSGDNCEVQQGVNYFDYTMPGLHIKDEKWSKEISDPFDLNKFWVQITKKTLNNKKIAHLSFEISGLELQKHVTDCMSEENVEEEICHAIPHLNNISTTYENLSNFSKKQLILFDCFYSDFFLRKMAEYFNDPHHKKHEKMSKVVLQTNVYSLELEGSVSRRGDQRCSKNLIFEMGASQKFEHLKESLFPVCVKMLTEFLAQEHFNNDTEKNGYLEAVSRIIFDTASRNGKGVMNSLSFSILMMILRDYYIRKDPENVSRFIAESKFLSEMVTQSLKH